MEPSRVAQVARLLVTHSCRVQAGERVLIEAVGPAREIVAALIAETKAAGGSPFVCLKDDALLRTLAATQTPADLAVVAAAELALLRQMQVYIGIRAYENCHELGDLPPAARTAVFREYLRPVHLEYRNQHLRRAFLRWPTPAAAQEARLSTAAYTELFFDCCLLDYAELTVAMTPLAELLSAADQVRLVGPGDTELSFSVRGLPAIAMAGRMNLPDGEVQTAPVRDSLNGRIRYNLPATYMGLHFPEVGLEFRNGEVVEVFGACDHQQVWNVLRQDEGARRVGEFAIGVNPMLDRPVGDLLFDEKLWGSIHLAQGASYQNSDNGNRSAVHWDLVHRQTPELGGGELYVDGTLVRKDGRFVLPELRELNPERLRRRVRLRGRRR